MRLSNRGRQGPTRTKMATGPQWKIFAQSPRGTKMRKRLIQLLVTSRSSAAASVFGEMRPAIPHMSFTAPPHANISQSELHTCILMTCSSESTIAGARYAGKLTWNLLWLLGDILVWNSALRPRRLCRVQAVDRHYAAHRRSPAASALL